MKDIFEPIIVDEIFDASVEQVWAAITELEQMKLWFFDNIGSFKAEIGFETRFVVSTGDRNFTHQWQVTEVIPGQKISYTWNYAEYPGDSLVSFSLTEIANQVKLTLTHSIVESFPADIPEIERQRGVEGWTYFISKSLKEFLEKE